MKFKKDEFLEKFNKSTETEKSEMILELLDVLDCKYDDDKAAVELIANEDIISFLRSDEMKSILYQVSHNLKTPKTENKSNFWETNDNPTPVKQKDTPFIVHEDVEVMSVCCGETEIDIYIDENCLWEGDVDAYEEMEVSLNDIARKNGYDNYELDGGYPFRLSQLGMLKQIKKEFEQKYEMKLNFVWGCANCCSYEDTARVDGKEITVLEYLNN